ncbi:MAG: glutaredoxin family protein [Zoogloeaceae bacterium]|jgi:glutaredoxin|nr:glutaredoxin family protein [Zoogloeaceae bacterium]
MNPFRLPHIILAVFCMAIGFAANAQTTYRWTDPVTEQTMYSDSAPPGNAKNVVRINVAGTAINDDSDLPFATRNAVAKYPVVLYTSASCESCERARSLLNQRKVPFTEKSLQNEEDKAALAKLVGDAFVPSVTVGRQKVRGFDAAAYNSTLDLAGYPKAESTPAATQ